MADASARHMLSVACVEGEKFTAQVVANVQEIPEAKILRDLTENAALENQRDQLCLGTPDPAALINWLIEQDLQL